jgi:hypothetical protein
LRRYSVLIVIEVQSRVVHVLGATTNPNGPWVTQVARNFASDGEDAGRRFRFLIGDRDTKLPTPRSLPLPPNDDGTVTRLDILGGIIDEYERAA